MVSWEEACWVFWMVKGHLNASESTIRQSYPSYLLRLWHNHEVSQRYLGFDEVYESRCSNMRPTQESNTV